MAWTTPRTWVAEVITATIMNSAVRDNLRYLKGLDGDITLEANILTAFNVDGVDVSSHESRHISGGADDIDSALAIAAMPNLTNGKVWKGDGSNRPAEIDFPTRTLSAANETVQEGYYAATTLSAVDADLAVGNIKLGTTIFGFLGTYEEAVEATIALFQAIPASEAVTSIVAADNINDNNTGTRARFQNTNAAAQVIFGNVVKIKRWRQYGSTNNTGNGRWKIQYWHISNQAWTDWVTAIPVRTTADWSGLSTEAEVKTLAIRLVCTTLDASGINDIYELEVIY